MAALIGSLAAWAVVTHLMGADWQAAPLAAALIAMGGVVVTLALGFVATWRALGERAAPVLRSP